MNASRMPGTRGDDRADRRDVVEGEREHAEQDREVDPDGQREERDQRPVSRLITVLRNM